MFRPTIKGKLEEEIEEHMEDAGFDSGNDFVRYCVRKELERLRYQRISNGGGR